MTVAADGELGFDPSDGHAGGNLSASRRAMCTSCDRPQSVCLCPLFPGEPLPNPVEVVLLQHPKERRQKNRSGWIAERCVQGVRTVVGRRLLADEAQAAVPALRRVWERPAACAVVFPCAEAKPLSEVAPGVELLIFLDATWRFAQEMLQGSTALAKVQKVEIHPPMGATPQFLVRKPVVLPGPNKATEAPDSAGGDDAVGDLADVEPGAPPRWGFCTAEAVALAVDAVAAARQTQTVAEAAADSPKGAAAGVSETLPGPAWEAVGAVIRGHVEQQLSRSRAVRHRTDRPGYIPGLYSSYSAAGGSEAETLGASSVVPPGHAAAAANAVDATAGNLSAVA